MKILLITTALLLSVSLLNAQEKKEVDTYKIAFFSKDASGVFKESRWGLVAHINNRQSSSHKLATSSFLSSGNFIQP